MSKPGLGHRARKWLGRKLLQPWARRYLRKERRYRHAGMDLLVMPGVFHPGLFISTKLLVAHLSTLELKGRRVLELGCGSGMVSIYAAKRGALVTASDINPQAVGNARQNALRNAVDLECVVSDLFEDLPADPFDLVVVNPPYYPRNPANDAEKAWYCGEGFEYFVRLFGQLAQRQDGQVLMILSEDCDLERIGGMARAAGLEWRMVWRKRRRGEWNYLFGVGA